MVRTLTAWLWDVQERFFLWLWRVEDVGPAEGGALRLRAVRYRGDDLTLADGTVLTRGRRVGEIHLRNDILRSLHQHAQRPRQVGWLFREALIKGLEDLAAVVEARQEYRDLAAFCGTTMLHYGAQKLGFETRPLADGLRFRLLRVYQRLLTARHHPLGRRRTDRGTRTRDPAELWISRDRLLALYGRESEHVGKGHKAKPGIAQPDDDAGESG